MECDVMRSLVIVVVLVKVVKTVISIIRAGDETIEACHAEPSLNLSPQKNAARILFSSKYI